MEFNDLVITVPSLEEHCRHTLERYGVTGEEIHKFMDELYKVLGREHRQFRHNIENVKLVGELFGKKYGKELAENIALDHLMLDKLASGSIKERVMDTDFCVYWDGNEKSKWCRHCRKANNVGEPCYELWKIVRQIAAQRLVFTNNRKGKAYGNKYRIESPSRYTCYLKMLQGKMSRFALPIEDFLYVTKTGRGGVNETPSRTRQNPFVDLLLEIIAKDSSLNGAVIINRVRAIPRKTRVDLSSDAHFQERQLGKDAGICPKCGSKLVWRKARLTGELYRGCTNWEGGCRYHERSYRFTPIEWYERIVLSEQKDEYFCYVCGKKIGKEEYEAYEGMCYHCLKSIE